LLFVHNFDKCRPIFKILSLLDLAVNLQRDPCQIYQQSRLLPIRSTFLQVLATNRQQHEFDSLSRSTLFPIRSTLLPIQSTLLPVCTEPKRHGRLCPLSTKSTVLNSTLSPVCRPTGLKTRDDEKMTSFPKRCIFIFWMNRPSRNWTG